MDLTVAVKVAKAAEHSDQNPANFVRRQRAVDSAAQIGPVNELHCVVRPAGGKRLPGKYADQVLVADLAKGIELAPEPVGLLWTHNLERDLAVERPIQNAIHISSPTRTEGGDNFISSWKVRTGHYILSMGSL